MAYISRYCRYIRYFWKALGLSLMQIVNRLTNVVGTYIWNVCFNIKILILRYIILWMIRGVSKHITRFKFLMLKMLAYSVYSTYRVFSQEIKTFKAHSWLKHAYSHQEESVHLAYVTNCQCFHSCYPFHPSDPIVGTSNRHQTHRLIPTTVLMTVNYTIYFNISAICHIIPQIYFLVGRTFNHQRKWISYVALLRIVSR
jgi:hypothetical protein